MKATRIAHQVLVAHCPFQTGAFMPPRRYYLGPTISQKPLGSGIFSANS
jgi:hypothetical protein